MTLRRSAAAQVLNGVVHTAWQNAGPIDKGGNVLVVDSSTNVRSTDKTQVLS
jgi:hypothetical protein